MGRSLMHVEVVSRTCGHLAGRQAGRHLQALPLPCGRVRCSGLGRSWGEGCTCVGSMGRSRRAFGSQAAVCILVSKAMASVGTAVGLAYLRTSNSSRREGPHAVEWYRQ